MIARQVTYPTGTRIFSYFKEGQRIIDLGSGPSGAHWWDKIHRGAHITAIDLHFKPAVIPSYVTFLKGDVCALKDRPDMADKFDLAVADHIFEHVADPGALARSIHHVLRPGGYVHVGIPDATNFTDRFYRLIMRNGGGHIAQFTRDSMIRLMEQQGFSLIECFPWPDDYAWFEFLYDLKYWQVECLAQEELKYLAGVFRKEITPEKGYFYGWEFVFQKK